MKIDITKEQYRDLIEVVLLGNWIRGLLYDQDIYKNKNYKKIEDDLLSFAGEFQSKDLIEKFHNKEIISDDLSKTIESIMESYDDFNFWDNLERRLGQRDFFKTMTKQERKEMDKNGNWFPSRIHEIYKEYESEFEKNGLDRLKLDKD